MSSWSKLFGKASWLGALLVAGVVVSVLVGLLVAGLRRGGEPGGAGDPLELVVTFIRAVEEEDVFLFLSCLVEGFPIPEPDPVTDLLLRDVKIDPVKFLETSFQDVDFRFEGVELSVEMESPDRARVATVSGMLEMNPLGVPLQRDLRKEPLVFDLVRNEGRWYLENNPVPYIT